MPKGNSPSQQSPAFDRHPSDYMKRKEGEFPPLVLREEAFVVAKFMLSGIRPCLSGLLLDCLVQKYHERADIYGEHRNYYKIYVDSNDK
tara:strand:- start:389 stop:655 length:267 start_codon:yes stop_codon:yes gene_type:complete